MKRLGAVFLWALLVATPLASIMAQDATLTIEEMKDLSRRAELLWSTDRAETPGDLLAENYVNHQPSGGSTTSAPIDYAAYLDFIETFHQSFSPQNVEVTEVIVEGNMTAVRWQSTAVHSGAFMGLAPTGKEISWSGMQVDRFENGKIVESWVSWDEYGFYKQLGLIP